MEITRLVLIALTVFVDISVRGADSRPNFLVLFADDLGINQINLENPALVGFTGENGTIRTPNLAKLAREGLTFQHWYSSFHVCSPSRASMLTGRYSIRSGIGISPGQYAPDAPGIYTNNMVFSAEAVGGLPENETTFAEALRDAGYATAAVGKWHLGQREKFLPTYHGFDQYLGIPFSQDMGLSFWFYLDGVPADNYQPTPLPLLNGTSIIEQPVDLSKLIKLYVRTAKEFIQAQTTAGKPWVLYLPFNHIHMPNSCSPSFCGRSAQGPVGDAVEEMDWAIGEIMKFLEDTKVDGNTVTFFTSDNGGLMAQDPNGNAPLRDGKASTWEGGFREPGIIRWPGKVAPGRVTQEIGATIDIFPTMLSLAKVDLPKDRIIDGIDLSPLMFNATEKGHECIMFYHVAIASNASEELYAVRCGNYKVYWATESTVPQPYADGKHNPPLMFDLVKDPSESRPVSNTSDLYLTQLSYITTKKHEHLATITPVPDQNGLGSIQQFSLCSNPNSQLVDARFPACTLNPANFHPQDICNSESCLEANPSFAKTCALTRVWV